LVVAVEESFELPQLTPRRATKVRVRVLRTGDEASGLARRVVLRVRTACSVGLCFVVRVARP
jgi:hypothetical protein